MINRRPIGAVGKADYEDRDSTRVDEKASRTSLAQSSLYVRRVCNPARGDLCINCIIAPRQRFNDPSRYRCNLTDGDTLDYKLSIGIKFLLIPAFLITG